jgi:predicted RNA-binding Zn ribbon-like protein
VAQALSGVLTIDLVGGYVCLDFANTVHDYEAGAEADELQTYADFVRWSARVGTVGETAAERLLASASAHPTQAASELERAKSLRRAVFDVFSAISDGKEPKARDLKTLGGAYADAMHHGQITKTGGGYEWRWEREVKGPTIGPLLWPIANSAMELLTSRELPRVRKCASDDCTWLFVDRSKNLSRRWCEMGSCGNRAKSRRHYQRTHSH